LLHRQGEAAANLNTEAAPAGTDLEAKLSRSQGSGSPLPQDFRQFIEPRMGFDFGQVRIHTDSEAVQMNQQLTARAFAHGSDVYFGAGQFDASSDGGKRLLAHELTHVVQQTGGIQKKSDDAETEPIPASGETDAQSANSENLPDVDQIVNQIINAIQTDSADQSGQIKRLIYRLSPSTRQAVLSQLQTRLTVDQQQSLQNILSESTLDEAEPSPGQVAFEEANASENQAQVEAAISDGTDQMVLVQTLQIQHLS
jgi:hypothetical protein